MSSKSGNEKAEIELAEKIAKVKAEAITQANGQSHGTFVSFDSSFANLLVPVIPSKPDNH